MQHKLSRRDKRDNRGRRPQDVQAEETAWNAYQTAKSRLGPDNAGVWDLFFAWWALT